MRDRALHTEGRRRKGAETALEERAAVARALWGFDGADAVCELRHVDRGH
jgi:hypothetical protein